MAKSHVDRGFFVFITDLLKEFKFDLQIKNYSNRTIETYIYNSNQLVKYLNEYHVITEIETVSTVLRAPKETFNYTF